MQLSDILGSFISSLRAPSPDQAAASIQNSTPTTSFADVLLGVDAPLHDVSGEVVGLSTEPTVEAEAVTTSPEEPQTTLSSSSRRKARRAKRASHKKSEKDIATGTLTSSQRNATGTQVVVANIIATHHSSLNAPSTDIREMPVQPDAVVDTSSTKLESLSLAATATTSTHITTSDAAGSKDSLIKNNTLFSSQAADELHAAQSEGLFQRVRQQSTSRRVLFGLQTDMASSDTANGTGGVSPEIQSLLQVAQQILPDVPTTVIEPVGSTSAVHILLHGINRENIHALNELAQELDATSNPDHQAMSVSDVAPILDTLNEQLDQNFTLVLSLVQNALSFGVQIPVENTDVTSVFGAAHGTDTASAASIIHESSALITTRDPETKKSGSLTQGGQSLENALDAGNTSSVSTATLDSSVTQNEASNNLVFTNDNELVQHDRRTPKSTAVTSESGVLNVQPLTDTAAASIATQTNVVSAQSSTTQVENTFAQSTGRARQREDGKESLERPQQGSHSIVGFSSETGSTKSSEQAEPIRLNTLRSLLETLRGSGLTIDRIEFAISDIAQAKGVADAAPTGRPQQAQSASSEVNSWQIATPKDDSIFAPTLQYVQSAFERSSKQVSAEGLFRRSVVGDTESVANAVDAQALAHVDDAAKQLDELLGAVVSSETSMNAISESGDSKTSYTSVQRESSRNDEVTVNPVINGADKGSTKADDIVGETVTMHSNNAQSKRQSQTSTILTSNELVPSLDRTSTISAATMSDTASDLHVSRISDVSLRVDEYQTHNNVATGETTVAQTNQATGVESMSPINAPDSASVAAQRAVVSAQREVSVQQSELPAIKKNSVTEKITHDVQADAVRVAESTAVASVSRQSASERNADDAFGGSGEKRLMSERKTGMRSRTVQPSIVSNGERFATTRSGEIEAASQLTSTETSNTTSSAHRSEGLGIAATTLQDGASDNAYTVNPGVAAVHTRGTEGTTTPSKVDTSQNQILTSNTHAQRILGLQVAESVPQLRLTDEPPREVPTRVFRVPIENLAQTTPSILRQISSADGGSARLILSPEALGMVVVNLNLQEGERTLHMEVASQSARVAVEAQLGQLREQFASTGVKIDAISVSVRESEQAQQHNLSQQHSGHGKNEEREARSQFLRSIDARNSSEHLSRERGDASRQGRNRYQQRRNGNRQFEQYA